MFTLDFADYIALGTLSLVGGWLGSFLNGYLGAKGQNLATKEDFTNLLSQAVETTRLTEEIKTKLSTDQWMSQEHWKLKAELYLSLLVLLGRFTDKTSSLVAALRGTRDPSTIKIEGDSEAERYRLFALLQLLNPELARVLEPIASVEQGAEDAEAWQRVAAAYRQTYFAVAEAARTDLGTHRPT